jgi:son of sevenless
MTNKIIDQDGMGMKFTTSQKDQNSPESILPERNVQSFRKLIVLDWDPREIARQLAIIDFELLCQINLEEECFQKSFSLENRIKNAKGFHAIIERTNDFALFITFEIVKEENTKKRIKIFEHFINVAKECIDLENFSSGFSILGGLNSSTV